MLAIMILFLSGTGSMAQSQSIQIVIKNEATQQPVSNVLFRYGQETGVTAESGLIDLNFAPETKLELSHISFGSRILLADEVLRSAEIGYLLWLERTNLMQPLTVVSVRAGEQSGRVITPQQQDKLSHDGGSFLSKLPSFSGIRKSGGYGYDPVLRGFKYDQLNVVIDGGMTASAACPNRMDPPTSQIAMNMIDRVEVLKGPYALRYGNSFGGTINFISTEPGFSETITPYGRFSGSVESNKAVYRSEIVAGLQNAYSDVSLFGSWSESSAYVDGRGQRINAAFERGSYGLKAVVKPASDHTMNLTLQRNVARDTEFAALPMDLISDKTWLGNLSWNYLPGLGSLLAVETTAWFSYVDHFMSNELRELNPRMSNNGTQAETINFGGRSEAEINLATNTRVFSGIDFRSEQAEGIRSREMLMGAMAGNTFYDNAWQKSRIQQTGIFSELQHQRDWFRYVIAARLDVNVAEALDPDDDFLAKNVDLSEMQLNPSISAGVVRSWGNAFETGVWVGRASRSGSITERYINQFPVGVDPYEMLGNPILKPEVNHQVDLVSTWSTSSLRLELNLFQSVITNYISSEIDPDLSPRMAMSPGVRRFTNLERAYIGGIEGGFSQLLGARLNHSFQMAWTYGEDLETGEALPEIAPLDVRYSFGATMMSARILPEITLRHVLAQKRISERFGEQKSESFTRVDVNLTLLPLQKLHITTGIQNLFDEAYFEHLNRAITGVGEPIHEPGRNFYITVGYSF